MSELIGGKLIGQGTYGCVYYPGIDCHGKRKEDKKHITKVQVYDEVFIRELTISNIIRGILNYEKYYVPITESCSVNFNIVNKSISDIKDCNVVEKNKNRSNYVLTQELYIPGPNLHVLVGNFIKDNKDNYAQVNHISEKLLFFYSYLSKSVEILSKHNIIHYDLKSDNIVIKHGNNSSVAINHNIPYIIDFGMSIDMNAIIKMLEREDNPNILQYLKQYFFTYASDVEYWPLEIHVICYILHSSDSANNLLNMEKIKNIIQSIIENNKILKKCDEKYIKEFKEQSIKFMYEIINKNKTNVAIIKKLISYYKSWNQYALDAMMLHGINKIKNASSVFEHSNKSRKHKSKGHKSKSNSSRKNKKITGKNHVEELNHLGRKLLTNIGIHHRAKQAIKIF